MQAFPHEYHVAVMAGPDESAIARSAGLPDLVTAPPAEFDGPGDCWSPETLLAASLGDCFALTFRAAAKASDFEWSSLECRVCGVLERDAGKARFTSFRIDARLSIPQSASQAQGDRLLHKAETNCLISNSLSAAITLSISIEQAAE
jgi:organic hydroperoxide reductase OsmC/OhrA